MAKRGRPAFKPTATLRRTVEEMRSCGETPNIIARAIGIDDATLKKHFPEELANGLATKRREVVTMLYRSARKGNVTAQKRLEEMTRLAGAEEVFDKPTTVPDPPAPKKGKKEAAQEAADTAGQGSEWGSDLDTPSVKLH